jgi:hypothetical protein
LSSFGVESIRGLVHSRFSPFGVESFVGSVILGSVILGSVILGSVILDSVSETLQRAPNNSKKLFNEG